MSTYYEYRDVKVLIAHRLMAMDGWKVHGYKPDHSDMMTDYYDPANWCGIAEKNGYVLCVDVDTEEPSVPIKRREYADGGNSMPADLKAKIAKLEAMTMERGATVSEEETAKAMIKKLTEKITTSEPEIVITGYIPAHMANPPRMNWHIEKDGVYVAKGNGILKFSGLYFKDGNESLLSDIRKYKENKEAYHAETIRYYINKGYTEKEAAGQAEWSIKEMDEDIDLMKKFDAFIHKLDTTCGALLGEGDGKVYEKVTVTEYKEEVHAVETTEGELKEGQCFILKTSFNYSCYKGLVYRIYVTEGRNGEKIYSARKLNGKLTKECTGMASSNNHWFIGSGEKNCNRFLKWIENNHIAWCNLEKVRIPYEVEKVVKKTVKRDNQTKKPTVRKNENEAKEDIGGKYTYQISEDTDTRTGERIFLARIAEKLTKDEYIKVNNYMKSIGGYYSRFKHAFLFRQYPGNLVTQ